MSNNQLLCWKCQMQMPDTVDFCQNCGSPSAPQKPRAPPSSPGPRYQRSAPPTPSIPQVAKVAIPTAPVTQKRFFGRNIVRNDITEEVLVNLEKKSDAVIQGLKRYYAEYMRPLEKAYEFHAFHSPSLNDIDFECPPMVLLLGQYSTGKTSFIQYIVERSFAGMRIGPEPTTDRFTAVIYGKEDRVIPGHALTAMADQPFRQLQNFGASFLNHFEAAATPSPILEKITFIDSPGVLSGEKQRLNREYDFPAVTRWFAERSDRILLLFDTSKLDISDEYRSVIECLQGHHDKMRCILNKADQVSAQELMRVYGALMWSLGRVIKSPEVLRVYVGSFWAEPLRCQDNEALLLQEEADLLADLRSLPRGAAIRRVNDIVKRARQLKVHMLIIEHLRKQFGMFGKKKKQEKLLKDMVTQFKAVQSLHGIPTGDFPHMSRFVETLKPFEIWNFPELSKKKLEKLDWLLSVGIPELMKIVPPPNDAPDAIRGDNITYGHSTQVPPQYSPESAASEANNPFHDEDVSPIYWAIPDAERQAYSAQFFSLKLSSGRLSGAAAKPVLMQTGVSASALREVWALGDVDRDGYLDADEFTLCMALAHRKRANPSLELPTTLPIELVPPTKREQYLQRMRDEGRTVLSVATHPHLNLMNLSTRTGDGQGVAANMSPIHQYPPSEPSPPYQPAALFSGNGNSGSNSGEQSPSIPPVPSRPARPQ